MHCEMWPILINFAHAILTKIETRSDKTVSLILQKFAGSLLCQQHPEKYVVPFGSGLTLFKQGGRGASACLQKGLGTAV